VTSDAMSASIAQFHSPLSRFQPQVSDGPRYWQWHCTSFSYVPPRDVHWVCQVLVSTELIVIPKVYRDIFPADFLVELKTHCNMLFERTTKLSLFLALLLASCGDTRGISKRATTAAPSPTQSGLACNCNAYYKVVAGDTCYGIVTNTYKNAFTLNQLSVWRLYLRLWRFC